MLLEGGLDWKALSLSPKDMDFAETRAGAAREIALAFGVPPLLLGLPGDNTYSNFQEANRAFWRQTVIPLAGRLHKSFAAWLTPAYGALRFEANLDRIDALAEERALEWRRIGAADFLTLDERREAAGYGPAPEGFAMQGVATQAAQTKDSAALELRYSPDQPRAPAGSSDGGQWVSAGGGGGGGGFGAGKIAGASDTTQDILIAGNDEPKVANDASGRDHSVADRFKVDLTEEEAQGGHTIVRHVARSKEQLIQRADRNRIGYGKYGIYEDRVGSFDSLNSAQSLINLTLDENKTIVNKVASGEQSFAELVKWFEKPTGYESYRRRFHNSAIIRTTFGVRVILIHDPRQSKGFKIKTAYPVNQDKK